MKIAALVSGGVDSSVALALLKEQGHDVTAFYLKIWLEDELSYLGNCPWQEDVQYAQAVCDQLDVPLHIVPLQREYWQTIVQYVIDQARAGFTPNPDVLCNRHIKFGAFLSKVDGSFDKVASGHYAHTKEVDGITRLYKTPDLVKDQTYFLSAMTQEQLSRAMFPLGTLDKSQVRALAHSYNLATKDRKDSQGICFLGKLKFDEFLKHYLSTKEGNLVEYETGALLGTHQGFWFYTLGQRQGLGLAGGPWYVVCKNVHDNTVYISKNYFDVDKPRDSFMVANLNWLAHVPQKNSQLEVKIRHGKASVACQLLLTNDGYGHVQLAERDQGLAPGQFAVFYNGEECLGSGTIVMPQEVTI